MTKVPPHHRRASGNNSEALGRITGAGYDAEALRRLCREGTARYAEALAAAGYEVNADGDRAA